MFMNVGGKLTLVVSVDKEGLEKYTSSEILLILWLILLTIRIMNNNNQLKL